MQSDEEVMLGLQAKLMQAIRDGVPCGPFMAAVCDRDGNCLAGAASARSSTESRVRRSNGLTDLTRASSRSGRPSSRSAASRWSAPSHNLLAKTSTANMFAAIRLSICQSETRRPAERGLLPRRCYLNTVGCNRSVFSFRLVKA